MDLFAKTMGAEVDGLDEEKVRIKLLGRVEDLPLTRTIFKLGREAHCQEWWHDACHRRQLRLASRDNRCRAHDRTQSRDRRSSRASHLRGSSVGASVHGRYARSRFAHSHERRDAFVKLPPLAALHAEFYVTDVLWPDFDRYELLRALLDFRERDRRFGKVDE